ncbi:MAG: CPBP family intramembrane metalloprotease [Firmicutes bacterium]|nr:CPBP family intramembrane metalloprotease [Bacillota bacterium]
MPETGYSRPQVIRYLIFTFAAAYAVQFGAARLVNGGNAMIGQLVIAAMMFVPALGVLCSGAGLKGLGWRPQLRRNGKSFLIAWFAPLVLTGLGAALFFLIFPDRFDLSGQALAEAGGGEALRQLAAQGLSYPTYVLISVIGSVTYAPLINAVTALGEEIGWRGFLYPQLKARWGRKKGWLLGGVIWGVWHWPLIWLTGYEYGTGYPGFPISGMLLFCVFTVGLGILHDRLYEKSGTIWVPAVFHGAVNAAATLPAAVCVGGTGSAQLLGPAPNGLLSGLPLLAVAAALFLRAGREQD